MDRLIATAWKAFWVGLGASVVLIAQTVIAARGPAPVYDAPRFEPRPAPSLFAEPPQSPRAHLYGTSPSRS